VCAHRGAAPRDHDRGRDPPHLALGPSMDAVDRGKAWFRLAWVAVSVIGLTALVAAAAAVLLA